MTYYSPFSCQVYLQVPRTTLNDRFRGKHASRLLKDSEETVLTNWMDTLATQGLPFDVNMLGSHVHDLTGVVPGVNWPTRFLKRRNELVSARGNGLDPARGKNFNKPTIKDYFEKLTDVLENKYGKIPEDHIWNMDEKGIQLGGG